MVDYIRLGRLFALLFVAALGVAAYLQFGIWKQTISARALSEVLGMAIGHVVLPAVIAVPWRLIQHRRHQFSDGPGGVGIIIFLLLSAALVLGANI